MSDLAALPPSESTRIWRMPIVPESYDRSPLTSSELEALAIACRLGLKSKGLTGLKRATATLQRFQQPIFDVVALRSDDLRRYRAFRCFLYEEMLRRKTSFWEWSTQEWIETLGITQAARKKYRALSMHASLMDIAYLLGGISDLREVDDKRNITEMARRIFGTEVIEREFHKITTILVGKSGRGYSEDYNSIQPVKYCLCALFLLNRSPYLEDFSPDLLQKATTPPHALHGAHVRRIQVALQELGLLASPEEQLIPLSELISRLDTHDVHPQWVRWCSTWFRLASELPLKRRRPYLDILLMTGRWLTANHPEIVSAEQWDEELALEYIHYTCTTTAGEYASALGLKCLISKGQVGKKLAPTTIDRRLCVMRHFFHVLQDRPLVVEHAAPNTLTRHFNPTLAFATPPSVKRLIQPDPRDIDEVIWCKLTYAAATLSKEDYAVTWNYPLSCYQAVALLWVTSARRPNEITRLQLRCIRRDWDPSMLDERGLPVSDEAAAQLCYLHVPANKTKGPFWVPIPRYTVEAIEAWERERPLNQPKLVDPKDHSLVDFLFCFRGKKLGDNFINKSLIPVLCKRAGIPEHDARGAITGHRARSTIATMLRKNGLSLDDISQFLGHARPEMVKAYARTDPFRFGREINRANDLMRIVEGIIDTRAAKAGKPNVFFFLGRGSDGQPRFCGNPAWEKCAHRLACLKCPMYVGADQASRLAERLEVRDELFKFQTQVEMTLQEKAAAEGDIETLTALIEADTDVPPPEPPNEEFRFNTSPPDTSSTSPLSETQTDLVALGRELAALTRELAAVEKRTDGRNASARALKKQIAAVTEQMAALDQIRVLTKASLGA